jgi:hypothetical protein
LRFIFIKSTSDSTDLQSVNVLADMIDADLAVDQMGFAGPEPQCGYDVYPPASCDMASLVVRVRLFDRKNCWLWVSHGSACMDKEVCVNLVLKESCMDRIVQVGSRRGRLAGNAYRPDTYVARPAEDWESYPVVTRKL